MSNPVLLIAGPTASGKSQLAFELAQRFDGVVINADSMQVYDELRIITARPSLEEEDLVPHRLYGIQSVSEPFSVARWLNLVKTELNTAFEAGKLPIITGGTGFYFSALIDGLADIPDVAVEVRNEVATQLQEDGIDQLHQQLREIDPISSEKIKIGDTQRLIRALEVYRGTGKPLSYWHDLGRQVAGISNPWYGLALLPERQELYDRCDRRLEQMLASGALEEVAALNDRQLPNDLPAMRALAVPQIISHLNGDISFEDMLASAQTGTRRYAKRQFTWINNKMIAWNKHKLKYSKRNFDEIIPKISEFLLTAAK